MCLGHDVSKSQARPGSGCGVGIPALVLVLEVLSQRGVLLEGFATPQAVHVSCSKAISHDTAVSSHDTPGSAHVLQQALS